MLPGSPLPRGWRFLTREPIRNPLMSIEGAALERSQYYPPSEIKAIQLELIKKLIASACGNVPFWRDWFSAAGLAPGAIKDWSDFEKIPIISKVILKKAGPLQYWQQGLRPSDFFIDSTSGSTGEPFRVLIDRRSMVRRIAVYKRLVRRAGLFGQRSLFRLMGNNRPGLALYGTYLDFKSEGGIEKNRRWIYRALNQGESVLEIVASKLLFLAKLMKNDGIRLPNLIGVLPVSEGLSGEERGFIESIIGCPTFNLYAAREIGFLGAECQFKTGLHINSEALYMEIVDQNGKPLASGEKGRVVVTVFDNLVMPLIRYDTGDLGVILENKCLCGRTLPILSLEGRPIEYLDLPDGSRTHIFQLTSLFHHYQHIINAIMEYQIVQFPSHRLKILIVPAKSWTKEIELEIRSFLAYRLSLIKDITIELVSEIKTDTTKKRRILIKER